MRTSGAVIFILVLTGLVGCAFAADSYTGEMKMEMTTGKAKNVLKLNVQHKGDLDRIDIPLGGDMGTMVTIVDSKNQILTMYNPVSKQGFRQKLGTPMGGPSGQIRFDVDQTIKQLKSEGYSVVGPTVEGEEEILGRACTIKKLQATKAGEKISFLFWTPAKKDGVPEVLKAKIMGGPSGTMVFCFTSLMEGAQVADSAFSVPAGIKITDQTKKGK
jgi:hypothetical protein